MELTVRIREIPEDQHLHFRGDLSLVEFSRIQEALGTQSGRLSYDFSISRSQEVLFLKGQVSGSLQATCDRCLEPFQRPQEEHFNLTLLPEAGGKVEAKEVLLTADDLDTEFYSGEWLPIEELLEEQLLLGLPMQNLCSEACQGLCPECGVNWNLAQCKCAQQNQANNPFAQLR